LPKPAAGDHADLSALFGAVATTMEAPSPTNSLASADSEALRAYSHAKQSLARQVQTLQDVCRRSGNEVRSAACRELLAKLAEDRFTLAVVGQFKRGKSSLMNALLGCEVLPIGVLPVTSAITVLRFGPTERLLVTRKAAQFPEEASVSRLSEYVTETGNPGNRKGISAVYVELPHPFLRRGLEFVDTPGVGSAVEANTATTYEFLPKCDAVVFVTSGETPFTSAEKEFLRDIREHLRKVFVVVNKVDLLAPEDREQLLRYLEASLREHVDAADLKCFPVSSRQALEAKLSGNGAGLSASGLPALEEALGRFLATERQAVLLEAIADKALRLCSEELREARAFRHLRVQAGAHPPGDAEVASQFAALRQQHVARVKELEQQVQRQLRAEIATRWEAFASAETPALERELEAELAERTKDQAVTALHWTALRVRNRLKEDVQRWWAAQQAELEQTIAEVGAASVQALWQETAALVDRLSETATVEEPVVESPAERRTLGVSWLPLGRVRWDPELPTGLKPLPLRLCRKKVRERLVGQLAGCLDNAGHLVQTTCERSLEHAVHALKTGLGDRTDRLENRARAAASGGKTAGGGRDESQAELTALRDQLLQSLGRAAPADTPAPARSADGSGSRPEPVQSLEALDLQRALSTRGCPVCDALEKVAFDFYTRFQYELSTSADAQRAFADEAGLCALHAWQLAGVSSPQGMSRGYPLWAERAAEVVTKLRGREPGESLSFAQLACSTEKCRVCELLRESAATVLARVAEFLQSAEGREAYERSQGLCLRHLEGLLGRLADGDCRGFLLSHAARRLAETAEDMRSYALKHDAIRRALVNRDERDAYLRALVHLVGARNLCVPWGEQEE